jgi:hypothetical protein
MIRPRSSTMSRSIRATVLRRCATTNAVRPSISRHSACWTSPSLSESSALVASSSSRIGASRSIARARATRCRCPPGQLHAALADQRVEPVGQRVDEPGHVRRLRRLADLGAGRPRPGERDVLARRPVEHRRVLRHVGDLAAQVLPPQPADVLPADEDPAFLHVRHPQQQPGQRGLAAAGPADQADPGPARHVQVKAGEQRPPAGVREAHALEPDVGAPVP